MEKESFEDTEVARLMNEVFVSIKVDREERTDLDHVYMTVCQMLTGSGGWPLTIIMTPDKKPFFAATYIPRESRFGKTGMLELIPRIREVWEARHEDVLHSSESIATALKEVEKDMPGEAVDGGLLETTYLELANRFDTIHGGFSSAPKFPTPHNLLFLLRYWRRSGQSEALDMVKKTLQQIRWGGIYDHIGFGFHRYSTDREWLVPHFEKMLYDQALLSLAYLETYQATGDNFYGDVAREIFHYVLRDLRTPEGGFCSAEDADSEGMEGRFYVWEERQIKEALGQEEADLARKLFCTKKGGNFREEATGNRLGLNILHTGKALSQIAGELGVPPRVAEEKIAAIRSRLFAVREKRIRPHKDDKILTDWNGLMIAALAKGAKILGDSAYEDAAKGATRFILDRLRIPGQRLLHRYRDREAGIVGHLDDYAFLVWGLLELYEATFDASYLRTALGVNEGMLGHFWDRSRGGLFFTPDDGESLLVRKKEIYDGAVPSGNSVAMHNLLRLARLTGRVDLEEKAAAMGRVFSGQIRQVPSGYTQFLCAADFALGPTQEVVLVGVPGSADLSRMVKALRASYHPNHVSLFRPSDEEAPEIDSLAPFVKSHVPLEGKATAYVCLGHACSAPTTEVAKVLELLG